MSVGDRLAVGLVRAIHGLRGGVRIEPLTDRPAERFGHGAILYREGTDAPLTILSAHEDDPGWLVRFEEIRDRTAAESLRGAYLEAVVAPGEDLARGEYYWHEVIGTTVRDIDGADLGEVVDVYRVGGAEVLVVRGEPYGEFDLPAVRAFIRIFAPKRGEIVVDVVPLDLQPPRVKRPRGRRASRGTATAGDVGVEATELLSEVPPVHDTSDSSD